MAEQRKKAGPEKGIVETRPFVEYLPAGVRVDPYKGNEPPLDPDLAKVRDEEIKALNEVKVEARPEPTIDPELVKARKAELERDAKRAGVKLADTSAGKAEGGDSGAPAPKKSPAKKSK